MQLRPYQQSACDAALGWLRRSVDPCIIDAAPAAGKSFVIAHLAGALHKISGKRVLCLAPSANLVKQNHEKFLMTGEPASIFSASAGSKSTRHVVVFATPGTVKNSISRFCRQGSEGFCAVVVDECHGLTPTIRAIIDAMREANPNLRVIGLSGTPFRLGTGYIYRMWPDDENGTARVNGDDTCREPYFMKSVYRVSAREMLDQGFITPMDIGAINHDEAYDTSGIQLLPNGTLNPSTVDRAFVGHGRKTAGIVADVIAKAQGRAGGVMLFAATVRHAEEVLASLPAHNSAMVTGDSSVLFGQQSNMDAVVKAYRAEKVRYLVSVGQLTTGFDVSHTETIALLRYTESAALLQQILGRAWRLHDGKATSLLLDYANNLERHFPDGDIYNPDIKAGKSGGPGEPIEAHCPDCGHINEFSLNPDYADYQRDKNGYCMDVFGARIETEYGPMSAHYGRRCFGQVQTGPKGEYERCGYRWTSKECPQCAEPNDIAARFCCSCKAEIVDPNERLQIEFKQFKKDPTRPQTDVVISMNVSEGVSQRGNRTIRADWVTPYRQFSTWFQPEATHSRGMKEYRAFFAATTFGEVPQTISYCKDIESGFFRILAYNRPADEAPDQSAPEKPELQFGRREGQQECYECNGPLSGPNQSGVCKKCYDANPEYKLMAGRRSAEARGTYSNMTAAKPSGSYA